jgi:hypothetical protein
MAVTETLELRAGLGEQLDRDLDAVVVNGLLPRRFSAPEMRRIADLDGSGSAGSHGTPLHVAAGRTSAAQLRRAAAHAAVAVHERARYQHNQVARLRRRDFEVLPVPFLWTAPTDVAGLSEVANHLSRHL